MPDAPRVLLRPGEVLKTERLSLHAASDEDVTSLSEWLGPAALSPDWQLHDLQTALPQTVPMLISDAAGEPIGVIVLMTDLPEPGAVSVPLVAVTPQRRFHGLGGEAMLAVEREVRGRWGVSRCFAAVPDGRGLAVYFWLRLGYRPLTTAQAPWPLAGFSAAARPGIWMLRDEA